MKTLICVAIILLTGELSAVDVINVFPRLQVVQGDVASFSAQFSGSAVAAFEARDSSGQPLGQVSKDSSGSLLWAYDTSQAPIGQQQIDLVSVDGGSISDRKSVILEITQPTPRQKWLQQYFGGSSEVAAAADSADPDADGKTNLQEFAFGLNPKSASDISSYLGVQNPNNLAGTGIRAVFNRLSNYAGSGLLYQVEFSSNLSEWHVSSDTPDVITDDGVLQKAALPFPLLPDGSASRFFRVKVSRSPTP